MTVEDRTSRKKVSGEHEPPNTVGAFHRNAGTDGSSIVLLAV